MHGSWASHHIWDLVVPGLAELFRVVTNDRRGHSQSERPREQRSIRDDVADLAADYSVMRLSLSMMVPARGNEMCAHLLRPHRVGSPPPAVCSRLRRPLKPMGTVPLAGV